MQPTVIQDHLLVVHTKAGGVRLVGQLAPLRLQQHRMQQGGAQGVMGLGGHLVASVVCKGARIGRVDLLALAKGARALQTGGGLADQHSYCYFIKWSCQPFGLHTVAPITCTPVRPGE
jgi:hypothetical protein